MYKVHWCKSGCSKSEDFCMEVKKIKVMSMMAQFICDNKSLLFLSRLFANLFALFPPSFAELIFIVFRGTCVKYKCYLDQTFF